MHLLHAVIFIEDRSSAQRRITMPDPLNNRNRTACHHQSRFSATLVICPKHFPTYRTKLYYTSKPCDRTVMTVSDERGDYWGSWRGWRGMKGIRAVRLVESGGTDPYRWLRLPWQWKDQHQHPSRKPKAARTSMILTQTARASSA